jgi:hypothetical protein
MERMMRLLIPALLLLSLVPSIGLAQSTAAGSGQPLRVYLDCQDCFAEYLRTEIRWVDFVRQREEADVHLLSSSNETGGGGREVVLRFVGGNRFQGVDQELRAISLTADTEDMRRRGVLRTVSVGLLSYAAREGLPSDINVSVRAETKDAVAQTTTDPWNFWLFSLESSASVDAEESSKQWSWDFGASADRVTTQWILSFGAQFDRETERFELEDEEEGAPLQVTRRESDFDFFGAKSLGEHWSVGLQTGVGSSTFENTSFRAGLAPAIEYNLFPWSEYASRQLRFEYSLGVEHARYHEITLFGKFRETLPVHEASATLDQRQPWGTLQASVEWSQYLHDLSKYRLEVQSDVNLRIARGFSLNLEGSASRVRDQIALPRRDASPEEVLLRLRELQSGYELSFDIGINYSFGSIFNNIVNPRFGR